MIHSAKIRTVVGTASVSRRMLLIQVFEQEDNKLFSVAWNEIIGFVTMNIISYHRQGEKGKLYERGTTDVEMRELGWCREEFQTIEVFPIILGVGENEDAFEIQEPKFDSCNLKEHSAVFCEWSKDQDEENVRRIAKSLINKSPTIQWISDFS